MFLLCKLGIQLRLKYKVCKLKKVYTLFIFLKRCSTNIYSSRKAQNTALKI